MSQDDRDGKPLHVLVVSDDPHVREDARYTFAAGVNVSFAVDSRQAWGLLRNDQPSIVVVDMQTGNAGGYALARDMAESPRLAGVPILILLERPQDAWLATTAGASAHRVKPLSSGELAATVSSLTRSG